MASWGNNDNAANTPLWAAATVNLEPTANNTANLFGNTTANVIVSNITVGLFGLDANEVVAAGSKGVHPGWILRKEFQGGRAGRVQQEVLVAMDTMNGDAEDSVYPDVVITIVTDPVDNDPVANGSGNTVTFTVVASGAPTSAPLTYSWEYYDGTPWDTTANDVVFTGNTTSTLIVDAADLTANTWKVRATVSSTGGVSKTSANATITIVETL
jgi:hypothetical protein